MSGSQIILIVEDDADIGQLLDRALKLEGYQTILASNGHEALAASVQQRPDLILLDYHLPGMSGEEFCRAQEKHPVLGEVPVVLMSAECDLGRLSEKIGLKTCVQKPIELDTLFAVVREKMAG